MKRCPECRRDYYDDTLLYCLDDGNALLEGPATASSSDDVVLGDKEKTFEWLEKAFQVRDSDLPRFWLGPTFDPIRDDPRYNDLLKRMHLPE